MWLAGSADAVKDKKKKKIYTGRVECAHEMIIAEPCQEHSLFCSIGGVKPHSQIMLQPEQNQRLPHNSGTRLRHNSLSCLRCRTKMCSIHDVIATIKKWFYCIAWLILHRGFFLFAFTKEPIYTEAFRGFLFILQHWYFLRC